MMIRLKTQLILLAKKLLACNVLKEPDKQRVGIYTNIWDSTNEKGVICLREQELIVLKMNLTGIMQLCAI
jgi:hypothetical protein